MRRFVLSSQTIARTIARRAPGSNGTGAAVFSAALAIVATQAAQAAVTISNKPTQNISCNAAGVCTPTHKVAVLNVNDVQNLLATSNVQINTGSGGLASRTSDIIIDAALTWASGNMLTLDAYHSVTVDKTVSDTGSGGLTILTNDGGSGGTFSFGTHGSIAMWSAADQLVINGAPYSLVYTIAELARLEGDNPSGHYALGRDFDASGQNYIQAPIPTPLTGTFEGLGNKITHFSLRDHQPGSPAGLFAQISAGGRLSNLELLTVMVNGSSTVGGFAAVNQGTITGEIIDGTVTGSATDNTGPNAPNLTVGGLVGENDGTISYSRSTASVSASVSDKKGRGTLVMAGGLVGFNNGLPATISASWAGGAVNVTVTSTGTAQGHVGGLVGKNVEGSIVNYSFAVGSSSYSGDGADDIGGLVGTNDNGTVTNASASGGATGGNYGTAGGLIGVDENVISCGCGLIENTVATGPAEGSGVGSSIGYNSGLTIHDSTGSGTVTGGLYSNHSIGGFVGFDQGPPSGDYANDSWSESTTGIGDSTQGAGNYPNEPGITGTP